MILACFGFQGLEYDLTILSILGIIRRGGHPAVRLQVEPYSIIPQTSRARIFIPLSMDAASACVKFSRIVFSSGFPA